MSQREHVRRQPVRPGPSCSANRRQQGAGAGRLLHGLEGKGAPRESAGASVCVEIFEDQEVEFY